MPLVKFYRGSYTPEQLLAKCQISGNIVFDNNTNRIYAGTYTDGQTTKPKPYGSNVTDATFTNNTLTITTLDSADPISLNFGDVASASQTMAVFTQLEGIMGSLNNNRTAPNYSSDQSGILHRTGQGETDVASLVAADLALAAAIADAGQVDDVQIGGTSIVDNNKVANIQTEGTYNASSNKIATKSTVTNAIAALDGSATIASESNGVVTIKAGVSEADGVISNASGSDITLAKVATSGAAEDVAYTPGAQSGLTSTNVQAAIDEVGQKVSQAVAGGVNDVKINGSSIKANNEADIAVDGTYNASTNKIATKSTVDTAIEGLDVTGYAQATVNTATAGQTTLTIKGIKEDDGKIANDTTNDADIVIDGEYNASTNKIATVSTVTGAITTAIQGLDGTATIASKTGNVVTIKTGVAEADGIIDNDSGTDIVLEEVAVTGAAADVSIADAQGKITATDVEGALTELALAIEALQGSFDVRVSTDAASTPQDVTWGSVTGALAASADTFHKIYLVPATGGASPNSYSEYITTKSTSGSTTTYSWEKLGDVAVDLTGYVKSITVNGKSYEVTSGSTNIALGDVVTAVTGETAISGGNSDLVAVSAATTQDSTTGANTVAITSTVKIEEVADGLTKDSTATYAAGHYVIENGKLVSAAGKSTGDTYTISANDGLTTASDVKAYVESAINNAQLTWDEWS